MDEPTFISKQTIDAKRFYVDLDPPAGKPLWVVCGGVEKLADDYLVQRSEFPYFGIELVAEGSGRLTINNRCHSLSRGSVFAYDSTTKHRIENVLPGSMRKYYLDFVGEDAATLLRSAGLLDDQPILIGSLIEVTDLWEHIGREAKEDRDISKLICQSLLRVLLLKIQQRRIPHGSFVPTAYRTYEAVRQHMEENYLSVTSVEQVANACGITAVYVSRLFNRYCTMGAYQYLLRLRMNHAAELLMADGMMVRDVANAMGFADAFQFSRAFKRVYGVAPSRLHQSRGEI